MTADHVALAEYLLSCGANIDRCGKAHERVPRKAVLRLRSLVARGRATTADPVFKALFASPNEIVWHVLSFWDARIE